MSNTKKIKVTAPPAIVKAIDEEVENGKFTGRGDFVLYAIRYYMDNHKTSTAKKESED